jgi:hypothetical protein
MFSLQFQISLSHTAFLSFPLSNTLSLVHENRSKHTQLLLSVCFTYTHHTQKHTQLPHTHAHTHSSFTHKQTHAHTNAAYLSKDQQSGQGAEVIPPMCFIARLPPKPSFIGLALEKIGGNAFGKFYRIAGMGGMRRMVRREE